MTPRNVARAIEFGIVVLVVAILAWGFAIVLA
jgi:hypothetical protein